MRRAPVKLMIATTLAAAALATATLVAADGDPAKRLDDSAAVLTEIMSAPDKGIPADLLGNAHCLVIVPDLKTAAFGVGGKSTARATSCRQTTGHGWSHTCRDPD